MTLADLTHSPTDALVALVISASAERQSFGGNSAVTEPRRTTCTMTSRRRPSNGLSRTRSSRAFLGTSGKS